MRVGLNIDVHKDESVQCDIFPMDLTSNNEDIITKHVKAVKFDTYPI